MHDGYVKWWRCALDSDLYAFQDLRLPGLFSHLLLRANWKPGKWRGHEIPAGACVVQTVALAKELGLSRQAMRGLLGKLRELEMIQTENLGNRATMIVICNWYRYQGEQPTNNQPNDTAATNQQPTEPASLATGCSTSACLPQPTNSQPNDATATNQQPTPNTEEGKKNSSPPIVPPKGVGCSGEGFPIMMVPKAAGAIDGVAFLTDEAKRLGAMFCVTHEAIRSRPLAPTVLPYADLLCQRALNAGVVADLIEDALAWLPTAHGQTGVPRIRDPRQLPPEWFESVADAKARISGQRSFQRADETKDYGI